MRIKEVKSEIKSVENIFRITYSLEVLSAMKMRKALKVALSVRPFARKVMEILERLGECLKEAKEELGLYFQKRKTKRILAVVVASDRGFCGSFNKNILKFAEKEIEKCSALPETSSLQANKFKKENEVEIFAIGKKAIKFFKKRNWKMRVEFFGIGDYGDFEEIKPIAKILVEYFKNNEYQKIYLFYTEHISAFLQKPVMIQILPVSVETLKNKLREATGEISVSKWSYDYLFEPSAKKVLEGLVPFLIEFQVYQAILEANASEHSARMTTMKKATDNSREILKNLGLIYNKLRQAQITSEISEISLAKKSLELWQR